MKNNKGYSLVELIVVIAIIVIIASGVTMSIHALSEFDVKQCTIEIYSYLGRTKIEAMSKAFADLEIYKNNSAGGDYYLKLSTEPQAVKIGKSNLTVTYYTEESGSSEGYAITGTGSSGLKLTFDRSSGALKPLDDLNLFCVKISIKKGSKEAFIIFIPETGKFYIQ